MNEKPAKICMTCQHFMLDFPSPRDSTKFQCTMLSKRWGRPIFKGSPPPILHQKIGKVVNFIKIEKSCWEERVK